MKSSTLHATLGRLALGGALLLGSTALLAQNKPVPMDKAEAPKYGGTLSIAPVYYTISALTWDPADWNWKSNHDMGQYAENLFAADLSKSRKYGGKHQFVADAYLPLDAIRGEIAESWRWMENPLRLEVKVRQGVMFPEKKGVMAARELVADDVVASYNNLDKSPKRIPAYFDHLAKVEATGKHTVLFTFKDYFAEWDYRFGWGYYSNIFPREVLEKGAKDWKNHNGSGPFMLTDFVNGNSTTFTKNPNYWDKERLGGQEYKLPFVDRVIHRTNKD